MRNWQALPFRSLITLVCIVVSVAASAATVAPPSGGSSQVEWKFSSSGHERIDLTVVAPNGRFYTRQFKAGTSPSFALTDLAVTMDGVYTYELRVIPAVPASVRRMVAIAREAGDEAAAAKIMEDAGIRAGEVRSGAFTIRGGAIVPANVVEPAALQAGSNATARPPLTPGSDDQVIPDDLIVQGSTCIGLDCVNNEIFGFDTLRFKENNIRIKAEDTSASGFPTTDWQLTFNDSAAGGQAKFSIEDVTAAVVPFTVEAASTTNSIYVDSTGLVGFRTATPVLDLHVHTSNTPALRFDQNATGGFTAQTWDVAGNEANFFVRDVTSGSRLPFRIRPGAPTSSIDIAANGWVGIATAAAKAPLHVSGTNTSDVFAGLGPDPNQSTGGAQSAMNLGYSGFSFGRASGFINIRPDSGASAPNPSLRFMTGNAVRLIIDNEGFIGIGTTANPDSPIHYTNGPSQARLTAAGVWQDASSRAAKDGILELDATEAVAALHELTPVKYYYKALPDDPKVGFIAEDVPGLVATPQRDGLSALDIVAVVTRVVQEQQKTIEELKQRIDELEKSRQ